MKAIRVLVSLVMASTAVPAALAADQSLGSLIASNLSSHYQSPTKIGASVAFSCKLAKGRYEWEQSSDAETGYFRVTLVHVEVNDRSLPASELGRINGLLAGPALLRSSFVSCSGRYVDIQLDLHRILSPDAVPLKTASSSYVVQLKDADLLDVRTLPDT